MAKEVNLKGIVEKVVRVNGKPSAQIIISIPMSMAMEIPLGGVAMTIAPLQLGMDDAERNPSKPVRGNKG